MSEFTFIEQSPSQGAEHAVEQGTTIPVRTTEAINVNTAAMKLKWPTSTPVLNSSSASGMCPSGNPA